ILFMLPRILRIAFHVLFIGITRRVLLFVISVGPIVTPFLRPGLILLALRKLVASRAPTLRTVALTSCCCCEVSRTEQAWLVPDEPEGKLIRLVIGDLSCVRVEFAQVTDVFDRQLFAIHVDGPLQVS